MIKPGTLEMWLELVYFLISVWHMLSYFPTGLKSNPRQPICCSWTMSAIVLAPDAPLTAHRAPGMFCTLSWPPVQNFWGCNQISEYTHLYKPVPVGKTNFLNIVKQWVRYSCKRGKIHSITRLKVILDFCLRGLDARKHGWLVALVKQPFLWK